MRAPALLAILLAAQVALAVALHDATRLAPLVPPPPPAPALTLFALGDAQLAYRLGGLALQNFGDSGGRATPLADYDYDRVIGWIEALVRLDGRAWYVPMLAANYYSQTPVAADARAILGFLERHALARPAVRWRLLAHAVQIARHRLADLPLALALARRLAALEIESMPIWTRQIPAQILAEMGETEAARVEIEALARRFPDLAEAEARWQRHFLDSLQPAP